MSCFDNKITMTIYTKPQRFQAHTHIITFHVPLPNKVQLDTISGRHPVQNEGIANMPIQIILVPSAADIGNTKLRGMLFDCLVRNMLKDMLHANETDRSHTLPFS